MSKHHHGHHHHHSDHSDHNESEHKGLDHLELNPGLLDLGSDKSEKSDSKGTKETKETKTPPASPEAKSPDSDATAHKDAESDKKPELHISESQALQDAKSNTTTGEVINPGTTAASIDIVKHATPAADAAIRGHEAAIALDKGETPEPHPDAEAMNPGPKPEPVADSMSGNSITGATEPKPFAPWDDAKEKVDGAKDELVKNLEEAAKPVGPDGPVDEPVPMTDSSAAEKGDTGIDDLKNASGLSAIDETKPVEDATKPEDIKEPKQPESAMPNDSIAADAPVLDQPEDKPEAAPEDVKPEAMLGFDPAKEHE